MIEKSIDEKFKTKYLPIEYKILEWRMIINKELYDEKVIDLKTFSIMERQLLGRMAKLQKGA